ncbi:MAG TPA: nuclear transport factor 2 family protein [Ktedonobacteraceae bacterium]|jgi:predicted ester cyclase|nr:nuclear transport factor 2 family protein [Ktedonobacteraceae bacterium]
MSTEDNKALVLSLYNARQQGNLALLDQIISPDFITAFPGNPQPLRGSEGIKQMIIHFNNTFHGVNMAINDQIAEGDKVVVIYTTSATTSVPMMGMPPGQQLTVVGIDVWQVMNGKIVNFFGLSQPVPNA